MKAETGENKNSLEGKGGFIVRLIEWGCPFNSTVFLVLVAVVMICLLGAVFFLGWTSSQKVKEVVTKDFNQQQLVLARHAAGQMENKLDMLKDDLKLLSLSPSIQYFEKVSVGKRMGITFSSIKEKGTLEVRFAEFPREKTHIVDASGYQSHHPHPDDLRYLEWAAKAENKGVMLISEVYPGIHGDDYRRLMMDIAIPVWQVSVDETNPVATGGFSGVIIFKVDTAAFVESIMKGIRSGKTGYAWVINEKGAFLYHPESEFIGRNAFEARKEKKPTISFARINEIQKTMILTGKEDASWYISGWHGGREGEMKKLIAYSPLHLVPDNSVTGKRLWSVAVVAPISEVEDAIHSIYVRHLLLQAIIITVMLFGGAAFIFLVMNWSKTLEREVQKRTDEFTKSEQRYMSLIENAEDIIFTVDPEGNYLSINAHGAMFFGETPDRIVGRSLSNIPPWPSGETMLMTVREVFESKKGNQLTHPVILGDSEYWFNTNFRRLTDKDGNIYAVLGISRDITDRRKMEESSYHTEKLASMGTLAAGVAHEINNPLGIILGFTDLLLDRTAPGSEQHELLTTIERHGIRAKKVVENLLSFARYTERKEELVDLNKCVETVLSVVGNTLLVNKILIERKLSEGLPQVRACPEELQQVFFNIIANAVAEMKESGGRLTISTEVEREGLTAVRISDTGRGIKKEHRSRIFDPLFTTKKIGEGTGLGLSVSYGIIIKYGGAIDFETKTVEESAQTGTTFIIKLPAAKKTIPLNGG